MGSIMNIAVFLLFFSIGEIFCSPFNKIIDADWKIRENAERHRTSSYEMLDNPLLVIRRGESFNVKIQLQENYDVSKDQLRLTVIYDSQIGLKYEPIFVTVFSKAEKDSIFDESRWKAFTEEINGKYVSINITAPADTAVGFWNVTVDHKTKGKKHVSSTSQQLAILFNPWCEDDNVYMPNEEHRREYVLNPIGQVYLGSHDYMMPKVWKYGQFSSYVLPIVIILLENYGRQQGTWDLSTLGHPVHVSRALSSVINANDGNGIIAGKWNEPYAPFTEPDKWVGSEAIFKEFFDGLAEHHNLNPVRWGQCWVFASTTTAAARAIGLPARPVSCFGSRHDTDESLTIDTYFDENGHLLEEMNNDMEWNFHVWTEAWMSRDDVPDGFGGWQAIDATPQEQSDGLSQAGPAPVNAIRAGEIGYGYDAAFVFGEVDADIVHWFRNESDILGWTKVPVDQIPTTVFTKKIGNFNNSHALNYREFDEDVTDTYKYPEDSYQRRVAKRNAQENRGLKFIFDEKPIDDNIELHLKIHETYFGEFIKITLNIVNKFNKKISVSSLLNVNSIYYRGLIANSLALNKLNLEIGERGTGTHEIYIKPDEYLGKMVDFDVFKVFAIVSVDGGRIWSKEATSMLKKPSLNITLNGHIRVGEKLNVNASFVNPLNEQLTDGYFIIEFNGQRIIKKVHEEINAKETVSITEQFELTSSGYEAIVVTFHCKQMSDIYGYVVLDISPKN
ncbi:hemocyte protein-glutamine gamma-glutamyltransferase-like protein [Leptotrombidium deliense]|uniref:Hemocyte protein-glutamine gamma-glutamyltransferase-like protein n=1 Tax=Leptotrombidium deliense TaxID=299467 RepID=A0A443SQE8_9ACAR|nr:hemocyte protein-glutamine gamma-glutamyltransferase-like protein [Leptotrombidium deliense]